MSPGALLVDKPEGPTSHDVVDAVRRATKQRRCGHTGTLDPFATGLLILLLGRATRLARFLSGAPKSYEAGVRFGFATDTYDRTGQTRGPVIERAPERAELERALEGFLGVQMQEPPPFSAKKIGGARAYRLARAGRAPAPAPVRVEIRELRLMGYEPPVARVAVSVSSGTYIRSLAHDLGKRLGVGAHLEALRRTRVGSFRVEEALSLEAVEELAGRGALEARLLAPEEVLIDLPLVEVGREEADRLAHGRSVPWSPLRLGPPDSDPGSGPFRVVDELGALVAVVDAAEDRTLRPVVVWAESAGGYVRRSP